MQLLVGAFSSFMMLGLWFVLGGAGHGWMEGSLGALALTPITFLAALNAAASRPSTFHAVALLVAGTIVLVVVVNSTLTSDSLGFERMLRAIGSGLFRAVLVVIGISWALLCGIALYRAKALSGRDRDGAASDSN